MPSNGNHRNKHAMFEKMGKVEWAFVNRLNRIHTIMYVNSEIENLTELASAIVTERFFKKTTKITTKFRLNGNRGQFFLTFRKKFHFTLTLCSISIVYDLCELLIGIIRIELNIDLVLATAKK